MKKFVVDFFRNYPVCTGLLSFLIALHLIGAKDLRTPIVAMNKDLFPLFFLYVFINMAMVLGLIPVVGIPLALISYGGTVILSVMASFGMILSVWINRNVNIGK